MSPLTTLAAAPDAVAPWLASVLAFLAFLVLMFLAFSRPPGNGPSAGSTSTDTSAQPGGESTPTGAAAVRRQPAGSS